MISVIIPVYNGEGFLTNCVRSVINNTYTDIEILIVDDGSADSSFKIMKQLEQTDHRIRLIRKAHEGVGSARNTGIKKAEGNYIAFIDADDTVSADYFEKLIFMLEKEQLDWVVCAGSNENFSNQQDRIVLSGANISEEVTKKIFWGGKKDKYNFFSNAMCLYSRDIIIQNNLRISETQFYGEDVLFNYEYAHFIKKFGYIPEGLYMVNEHMYSSSRNTSAGNMTDQVVSLFENIEVLRKKYGDTLSDEELMYFIYQTRNLMLKFVFKENKANRKMLMQIFQKKIISSESLSDIWKQYKISFGQGLFEKLTILFIKSHRYELFYRLWMLKKQISKFTTKMGIGSK